MVRAEAEAFQEIGRKLFKQGRIELEKRQFAKSIELFNKSLLHMSELNVYRYRGYAYLMLKKYDLALEDFSVAIKKENNAVSYDLRGQVFYILSDYKNSIEDFSKAIELSYWKDQHLYYIHRAKSFSAIENLINAKSDYTLVIDIIDKIINEYKIESEKYLNAKKIKTYKYFDKLIKEYLDLKNQYLKDLQVM